MVLSKLSYSALLLLLMFIGCSSNKLVLLEDDPKCQTTVEGEFISPQIYKYPAPAILFPEGSKYRYELGTVARKDSLGIFLLPKKQGIFHNPELIFYSYDNIRAIVDSNGYCVYGKLKDNECKELNLIFSLEKLESPDYKPIYLELKSNKKFAYCVEPGSYKVTKIQQIINTDTYYESFPEFYFSFEALSNSANYIGSLMINADTGIKDSTLRIPYYEQSTGSSAGAMGGFLGGAIGGAIAGAIVAANNNSRKDNVKGYFNIDINYLKEYKTDSVNELKNCPLILKRSEVLYEE